MEYRGERLDRNEHQRRIQRDNSCYIFELTYKGTRQ